MEEKKELDKTLENLKSSDVKDEVNEKDDDKASIVTLEDTKSIKPTETHTKNVDEIDKSQTKSSDKSDSDHLEISSGAQKLRDMLQVFLNKRFV